MFFPVWNGPDCTLAQAVHYKIDEGYDRNLDWIELFCISEQWNNLFLYIDVFKKEY